MKKYILWMMAAGMMVAAGSAYGADAKDYTPTEEILQARHEFSDNRFGIFLHWGIYSMMGQGEWYLNYGPNAEEYAKGISTPKLPIVISFTVGLFRA